MIHRWIKGYKGKYSVSNTGIVQCKRLGGRCNKCELLWDMDNFPNRQFIGYTRRLL